MTRTMPLALTGAGAIAVVIVLASAGIIGGPAPNPDGIISHVPMHTHPTLRIYNDQTPVDVPKLIGISSQLWHDHSLDKYGESSLAALHTHSEDNPGLIHVESTVTRNYTLGEFFSIWGQPLGPSQVMGYVIDSHHTLTLLSDGQRTAEWGALILRDGQTIEIHYDTV